MNVGDVYKTNYWGDVEVVELMPHSSAKVRFLRTENLKVVRIPALRVGSLKDTEAELAGVSATKKIVKCLDPIPVGTVYPSNQYGMMEVIEFRGSRSILVRFEDSGNKLLVQRGCLETGQIHDRELKAQRIEKKRIEAEESRRLREVSTQVAKDKIAKALLDDIEAKRTLAALRHDAAASKRMGQKHTDKIGAAFTVTGLIKGDLWKIVYDETGNAYDVSGRVIDTLYGLYDTSRPDHKELKRAADSTNNAASYEADRDRRIAMASLYQRNNKERTNARNRLFVQRRGAAEGSHTEAQKVQLLLDQNGKCNCCGHDLRNGKHIDHIMPIILGGSDYIENIQWLCQVCNNIKADRHPDEWAAYSTSAEYKERLSLRRG